MTKMQDREEDQQEATGVTTGSSVAFQLMLVFILTGCIERWTHVLLVIVLKSFEFIKDGQKRKAETEKERFECCVTFEFFNTSVQLARLFLTSDWKLVSN